MKRNGVWLLAAALLFFGVSCRKPSSDEEAIRASILQHLQKSSNLNLSAMDTEFGQITVNGDHAQAQVIFRAKQEGATMQMNYSLQRQNGEWTVLSSQPAGGQIAHPPVGGPPSSGTEATPAMPHLQFPSDTAPKPAKPT
jgi:hypothetical protein